jgi:hypothetical protein
MDLKPKGRVLGTHALGVQRLEPPPEQHAPEGRTDRRRRAPLGAGDFFQLD